MSLSVASSGPRLQPETTHMRRGNANYSASTFVQWLMKVVGQAENHYAVKMETVFFFETLVPTSQAAHPCNSECHSVILMKPSSLCVLSVLPKL
jgi:sensor c-di-GMP phosphodiesterase-like protein